MTRNEKERDKQRKAEAIRSTSQFLIAELPDMTEEELRTQAVMHWEIKNGKEVDPNSDEQFFERIAVNYVRHDLLGYDAGLRRRTSRIRKSESDAVMKGMALAQIAAKYPWLAAECQRQSD
jgi:hypothetical protein